MSSIKIKHSKILIFDDNLTDSKALYSYLRKQNLNVIRSTDGEYAIELVKNELPDIMLINLTVQSREGFDICKVIKKNDDIKETYP